MHRDFTHSAAQKPSEAKRTVTAVLVLLVKRTFRRDSAVFAVLVTSEEVDVAEGLFTEFTVQFFVFLQKKLFFL